MRQSNRENSSRSNKEGNIIYYLYRITIIVLEYRIKATKNKRATRAR